MGRQVARFPDLGRRESATARELSIGERAALEQAVQAIVAPQPRVGGGRRATRDEAIVAAWANLAVEEPDLTLDDVHRMIGERS